MITITRAQVKSTRALAHVGLGLDTPLPYTGGVRTNPPFLATYHSTRNNIGVTYMLCTGTVKQNKVLLSTPDVQ
jgi:hypothetical protein